MPMPKAKKETDNSQRDFTPSPIDPNTLKPHPRNYRKHPEDQLQHIMQSIREHGFYRNVVITPTNTILAGHGVVEAAKKMGLKTIPVIRVHLSDDDPKALKLLAGDNEISHLAEIDDRTLTDLLKQIKDTSDNGLFGTGFDEAMLQALVYNTRPASEVETKSAAAHWAGMPEYDEGGDVLRIIVQFKTEKDRETFCKTQNVIIDKREKNTWTMWWPFKERDDVKGLKFKAK